MISLYNLTIILFIILLFCVVTIHNINFKILKFIKKKKYINHHDQESEFEIVYGKSINYSFHKIKFYSTIKNIFNFEKMTELAHINYILNKYFSIDFKTNSKFYWYLFCKKYNLNHPKVYIVKQNNKIFNYLDINQNNIYLFKPLIDNQGDGIEKINGKNIDFYLSSKDNFLIQEFLKDNFSNSLGRHFRLITSYNGEVLGLYEFTNNYDFRSNGHKKGLNKNIFEDYLNNRLKFSKIENSLLNNYVKIISNIHKQIFKNLVSIGWDLMFHNNKIYLLEGNVFGHGTIFQCTTKNQINRYYQVVEQFLYDK